MHLYFFPFLSQEVDPSPDGEFLLVTWLEPPFSYIVPCGRFPQRSQLWRRDGSLVSRRAAGKCTALAEPGCTRSLSLLAELAHRIGVELARLWAGVPAPYSQGARPRDVCLSACSLQVRELAYLPLAEDIPIAFNSTRKVRRALLPACPQRQQQLCAAPDGRRSVGPSAATAPVRANASRWRVCAWRAPRC